VRVVQRHGAIAERFIRAEVAAPEPIADDQDLSGLVHREATPETRRHLQRGEVVGGHDLGRDQLRTVGARHVQGLHLFAGQVGERRGVRAQIQELVVRRGAELLLAAGGRADPHQIGSAGHAERPQQGGVDDAEHRSIDGDAERQRRDGGHGERGCTAEHPDGVGEIAHVRHTAATCLQSNELCMAKHNNTNRVSVSTGVWDQLWVWFRRATDHGLIRAPSTIRALRGGQRDGPCDPW
jgi:hypothetical protein